MSVGQPRHRRGTPTLRSRVAVLATLVAVLTLVSAVAFLFVATHTEAAVTRDSQRRLTEAVSRLAGDYAAHAEFQAQHHERAPLDQPTIAGSDAALTALTTASFVHESGVEGGFYARANDRLLGYAFPTHDGPGVKRDIPPIERPLIEDVARRAAQDRQSTASVFRGPRDVIIFDAVPIGVGDAVAGSAWAMQRLPGLRSERSSSVSLGVVAFAAASLLCVGLAFVLAQGVRQGVARIEERLGELEQDLTAPSMRTGGGLEELGRIYDGIDGLAASLRQRMASEQQLRQALEHKERLAALGQVAAGVAHELRNPLATIRLRTQMVGRANADADVQRSVTMVLEEIGRLDQMVERLLSFSRPITLRLRPLRVADVLDTSVAALGDSLRAAGVTVEREPDVSPVTVTADADRLRQVLDNVLQNAIEASPSGAAVTIGVRIVGEHALITVRDHGSGLMGAVADHLFDPFVTTKVSGTGLGLSIAYEIVHAHDGRIEIANASGGGVVVSITLPLRGPRLTDALPLPKLVAT